MGVDYEFTTASGMPYIYNTGSTTSGSFTISDSDGTTIGTTAYEWEVQYEGVEPKELGWWDGGEI